MVTMIIHTIIGSSPIKIFMILITIYNIFFNRYQKQRSRYITITRNESKIRMYSNFKWWDNSALGFKWNMTINCSSEVMPFNPLKHLVGQVASNDLACNSDKKINSNWILTDHLIGKLLKTRKLDSNWDLTGELSNTAIIAILHLKVWLLRINILSNNPVELVVMQYISRGTRFLGHFINNDKALHLITNGKSIQITDIMMSSSEIRKQYPNLMVRDDKNQFSYHVNGVGSKTRGIQEYGILRTKLLCLTNSQISQICNFLLSK